MAAQEFRTNSGGIAFLVSAGIVYEIIAAACSSPQTTEINAGKRAETLMKWVYLGLAQAGGFVAMAVVFDPANMGPIILGGAAAGFIMWAQYVHAMKAGLRSCEEGTEDY
jgi:hypothetical protein